MNPRVGIHLGLLLPNEDHTTRRRTHQRMAALALVPCSFPDTQCRPTAQASFQEEEVETLTLVLPFLGVDNSGHTHLGNSVDRGSGDLV